MWTSIIYSHSINWEYETFSYDFQQNQNSKKQGNKNLEHNQEKIIITATKKNAP